MDSYKLNLIYSNLDEAGKKLQKALKELYGISKRNAPDILRRETLNDNTTIKKRLPRLSKRV